MRTFSYDSQKAFACTKLTIGTIGILKTVVKYVQS